jgi:hypothetical protein
MLLIGQLELLSMTFTEIKRTKTDDFCGELAMDARLLGSRNFGFDSPCLLQYTRRPNRHVTALVRCNMPRSGLLCGICSLAMR